MNRPTLHIPSDERHRQSALGKMHRRVAAKRAAENHSSNASIDLAVSRLRACADRAGLRAVQLAPPSYAAPSAN